MGVIIVKKSIASFFKRGNTMEYNNTPTTSQEEGMNLETVLIYMKKIFKKWWVILISALVFAAVGLSLAIVNDVPTYSSKIMFIANNRQLSTQVSGQSSSDLNASVQLAESFSYIFKTTDLSTKVAQNCGYKDITSQDIKKYVSVEAVPETMIIYLTVTTTDKDVSYAIAKTYQDFYADAIKKAFPSTTLTVIDPPLLATQPNANNDKVVYPLLGFLLGMLLAVFIMVMAIMAKDTIKSMDDLQKKLDLKILGTVNRVIKPKKHEKESVLLTERTSGFGFIESFKLIRTKIEHLAARKKMKSFVVTSATENEGKTTTAVNLALALAKNGKEVLLIDGDLRKPAVAKSLGINAAGDTGILGVADGSKSLADSIKYSEKYNLYLLLSGQSFKDPSELLSTAQTEEIIQRAKEEFDYVIVDTPPSSMVADTAILAGYTDAIVMVVRQDTAPLRRIRRALDNLDNSGAEIIGCIYNDSSVGMRGVKSYNKKYGYGYGYEESSK